MFGVWEWIVPGSVSTQVVILAATWSPQEGVCNGSSDWACRGER